MEEHGLKILDSEPTEGKGGVVNESIVFPLELCCCCPQGARLLVPGEWQTLQGCTHLFVMVSTLASGGILLVSVTFLYGVFFTSRVARWLEEVAPHALEGVVSLLSMVYFGTQLRQYGADLQAAREELAQQHELLIQEVSHALDGINSFIDLSAISSFEYAEMGVDAVCRHLERFLDAVDDLHGESGDDGPLLPALIELCCKWFVLLGECSMDPSSAAAALEAAARLRACRDVAGLRATSLRELHAVDMRATQSRMKEDRLRHARLREAAERPKAGRPATKPGACSWVRCCAAPTEDEEQGPWPKSYSAGCCHVLLLSRSHVLLICLFGFSAMMMVATHSGIGQFDIEPHTVFLDVCLLMCLFVALIIFDKIDMKRHQQLEIGELAKQKASIARDREEAAHFWDSALLLLEVWTHRTIPILNLYADILGLLSVCEDDEHLLAGSLERVNQALEAFNAGIPTFEAWQDGGHVPSDAKVRFRDAVDSLCYSGYNTNLDAMLAGMRELDIDWRG